MPDFEFVLTIEQRKYTRTFLQQLYNHSVIVVIVKIFVALLFDIEKACRTTIFTKKKYFFASFNNDRGLSLDNKTKDFVDRNIGGQVNSLHLCISIYSDFECQ